MAQCLRKNDAFAEDPGPGPSTHAGWQQLPATLFLGDLTSSYGAAGIYMHGEQINAQRKSVCLYTHINKNQINKN